MNYFKFIRKRRVHISCNSTVLQKRLRDSAGIVRTPRYAGPDLPPWACRGMDKGCLAGPLCVGTILFLLDEIESSFSCAEHTHQSNYTFCPIFSVYNQISNPLVRSIFFKVFGFLVMNCSSQTPSLIQLRTFQHLMESAVECLVKKGLEPQGHVATDTLGPSSGGLCLSNP